MNAVLSQQNMAELLERLGVPSARIRLQPPPGTATEADLLSINESGDSPLCELIEGVLVEKPVGYFESRLASLIVYFLECYLELNNLGIVLGADGPLRLFSGTVRVPDVSFISWDRFPGRILPKVQIPGLAPDLAVEVLSPGNTKKEMNRKIHEYFKSGTQCVWMLDPKRRTMSVFLTPDKFIEYDEHQSVGGGTLLPGFQLSLSRLFERASQGQG